MGPLFVIALWLMLAIVAAFAAFVLFLVLLLFLPAEKALPLAFVIVFAGGIGSLMALMAVAAVGTLFLPEDDGVSSPYAALVLFGTIAVGFALSSVCAARMFLNRSKS